MDNSPAQTEVPKKGSIDSLSREELIKKCKGLLGIAQKAKLAKDELSDENKKLKEELSHFETQKDADKTSLVAMKEVVESLTENKLLLTNQVTDIRKEKCILEKKLESFSIDSLKFSEISIENEAFKRQISRLTDENEELLVNLDEMEKKLEQVNKFNMQQHEDLIVLEENWKTLDLKFKDLEKRLENSLRENEELQEKSIRLEKEYNSLQSNNSGKNDREELTEHLLNELKQENTELNDKIKNLTDQLLDINQIKDNSIEIKPDIEETNLTAIENLSKENELLRANEKRHLAKIESFKIKIFEFSGKLKDLKENREILRKTIQEYDESIPKWQKQIANASQNISKKLLLFEIEKAMLSERCKELQTEILRLRKNSTDDDSIVLETTTLDSLFEISKQIRNDFDKKCEEIESLNQSILQFEKDNYQLNDELMKFKNKLEIVENEKLEKCKEMENSESTILKLQNAEADEKKCLETNMARLEEDLIQLKESFCEKEQEIECLNNTILQLGKDNQENNLRKQQLNDELMEIKNKLEIVENEKLEKCKEIEDSESIILKLRASESDEKKSLETNLADVEKQLILLKESFCKKDQEIDCLNNEILQLGKDNQEINSKNHQLNNELTEIKNKLEIVENEKLDKCKEIENSESIILKLQNSEADEKKCLETNLADVEEQLILLKESFCKKDQEIDCLNNAILQLGKDNQEINSKNHQLNNELTEIKNKLEIVENEKLDKCKEIENSESIILKLQNSEADEKKCLETNLAGLEEELIQLKEEFCKKEKEIECLIQKANENTRARDELFEENKQILDKSNRLEEELEKIVLENSTLKEESTVNKELDDTLVQISNLEKEKLELIEKLNQLQEKVQPPNTIVVPNGTFENMIVLCNKTRQDYQDKCNEIKVLKENLGETLSDSDTTGKEYQDICMKYKVLNEEYSELKKEFELAEYHDQEKSIEIENLNETVCTLRENIESLKNNKQDTMGSLKEEIEQLKVLYQEKCNKVDILLQEQHQLSEEFKMLLDDLQESSSIINNAENVSLHLVKYFKNFRTNITIKLQNLQEENTSLNITLKKQNENLDQLQATINFRDSENSDLLSEMRELNEALKARGDVISRQQDKIKELETELKINSEKLVSTEISLSEKEHLITEKNTKINTMNAEIVNAKDEVANLSLKAKESEKIIKSLSEEMTQIRDSKQPDNQSDIISTSTISRVEEIARLRDVDESFEEKYNKLRSLAIKLKKKVQEQTAHILKLETENQKTSDEKNEINKKLGTISVQVKNLQALQNENDKLLDEVEKLKEDAISRNKEIKDLNDKINELLVENEKIKSSSNVDKKSKTALDNAIKEYQNKIKLLKQEKETFNLIQKELEKERDQLKKDVVSKEKLNVKLGDQLDAAKMELDKLKAAGKKSSVLNLEIEAYEKSLNDVTQKLDTNRMLVKELQESIESKENTNLSLKEQIKLLEESINSEKVHSQELKQQIDIHQAKLKETGHDKMELHTRIQDMTIETEFLKSEVDKLTIQLSEIASEKDKFCSSLQTEKENLMRQTLNLDETLDTTKSKLKTTERELEDLRAEYASYKMRAQSVLRQNQSKESSRERELDEEINTKQSTIEALNLKIIKCDESIESNERKIDELKDDNERLQHRCKDLIQLLEESRIQNDALLDDNRKQSQEYQESLKVQRLQVETLKNCFKKEIEDLERKHVDDLKEIHKRGNTSQDSKLSSRIGPFGSSSNSKTNDEQKIDLILMEREDAEGSETTSVIQQQYPKRRISSVRSRRDVIPLDELLNSSIIDANQNDDDNRSVSPSIELQTTKERLQMQESRVRHLTSLLSETEQDLAKLTHLNDVLKEEVRRQERAIEREQHIHNSEYLKNVVLKFLTLGIGDERLRLVPVLNTILKLSPEETNALQNVAKGADLNRSWGSYLPIWSNHQ